MVFSPSNRVLPPPDGSVPIGSVIDFHMQHNPNHTWAVLADADGGPPTHVTYEQFGQAIHRAAHILNPGAYLPRGTKIGILISTDTIMYLALIFGAMRAGLVPFPLSPRTQIAGISHLLHITHTDYVLVGGSSAIDDVWTKIQNLPENDGRCFKATRVPIPSQIFPSLMQNDSKAPPFIRFPNLGPTTDKSLVAIMHSSGSTGLPRALELYHDSAFTNLVHPPACWELGEPGDPIGLMVLPAFHMMGFTWHGIMPLYVGYTPVFFGLSPSPVVPTAESTMKAVISTGCKALMSVPTFLEAWAKDTEAISQLKKLRGLYYGGGALADWVGNSLASNGVPLQSAYGATEIGCINMLRPLNPLRTPEDWAYLEFTDQTTARLIPQYDEEGSHELVIMATERHKPLIINTEIEGQPAYATKDLLVSHPTKPGLWKTIGRLDDQIVLANGEKINPGIMEDVISSCLDIQLASMFGREKNQTGILVELSSSAQSDYHGGRNRTALVERIWPFIERANGFGPTHARLIRETVVFTDPERPLPRTPKGTPSRGPALKAYAKEIEEMYAALESGGYEVDPSAAPLSWGNQQSVEKWLHSCTEQVLGHELDPGKDLFQQGLDSLTATVLTRTIKNGLKSSRSLNVSRITSDTVFKYPSVSQLSNLIVGIFTGNDQTKLEEPRDANIAVIKGMIEKYRCASTSSAQLALCSQYPESVLLTGTTGGLGSHLLAQLLANDGVDRVWAINRKQRDRRISLQQRQKDAFEDKGLDTALLQSPKLILLESDITTERLGLPTELYEEITSSSSLFIHNGWQVNFNLSLQSFEPSIQATHQLIGLALASKNHPRFLFTSSVSAAGLGTPGRRLNETAIDISDAVTSIGYGQSKFVAEKMLESARLVGLETSIIRLGQLSGDSVTGAWPTHDWVPSILASSLTSGYLPDAFGIVSWTPLDTIARAVLEIGLNRGSILPLFVHCSHPYPIAWSLIMNFFCEAIESETGKRLAMIPLREWGARIKGEIGAFEGDQGTLFKRFPIAKIQGRIEEMVRTDVYLAERGESAKEAEADGTIQLGTTEGKRLSPSLKSAQPLGHNDVRRWVGYWMARGLFQLE
ncbi:acetyl-CoA synthetase-like protein [Ceratobasidium sp. AG-Ba]|nr:acetyl-CoA synthetase-like protein [Ceratobasidium sp. AG-Ba]